MAKPVHDLVRRFRQTEKGPAALQARVIAVNLEAPKEEAALPPLTVRDVPGLTLTEP
jgi:hypothetical protein